MPIFPLPELPKHDYHNGGIRFGSSRSDGSRRPGCDLIAKKGTPVLAVNRGIVLDGPSNFYHGTYSVAVQHGDFVVRYCEVDKKVAEGIMIGATVQKSQTIAYVGQMYKSSMLRFEMYQGSVGGNYTQKNNKEYDLVEPKAYKRRRGLLDQTPYLDEWRHWTDYTN